MRYEANHRGVAQLLVSDGMADAMKDAALAGQFFAESISPDAPPYAAGYVASFDTDVEVQGDRQTGILANTSGHAFAVELRDHVLGRTADWIEGGG